MERRYSYDEGMVLRTVYLPRELDEKLRKMAYEQRKSKNEIIRTLLLDALGNYKAKDVSVPAPSLATSVR
jgi:hypothetical protein